MKKGTILLRTYNKTKVELEIKVEEKKRDHQLYIPRLLDIFCHFNLSRVRWNEVE